MLTYVPYTDYHFRDAHLSHVEFIGMMTIELSYRLEDDFYEATRYGHFFVRLRSLLVEGRYSTYYDGKDTVYHIGVADDNCPYEYKVVVTLTEDREGLKVYIYHNDGDSYLPVFAFIVDNETCFNYGLIDFSQMDDDWEDVK